jgi:hypothetical protein
MHDKDKQVEIQLGRTHGPDGNSWTLRINDVASGYGAAEIELTDTQFSNLLHGSMVESAAWLPRPEGAARFGTFRWNVSIALERDYDGQGHQYGETRLINQMLDDGLVAAFGAEEFRVDSTNFGLRLVLYGYVDSEAERTRAEHGAAQLLDQGVRDRGWRLHMNRRR